MMMPTPLKKSFNVLHTSPNYASCPKYYSLFISSDLFSVLDTSVGLYIKQES